MSFELVDPSGNFVHLSTDLPLPVGVGMARGAISTELDTGKVYRYHQVGSGQGTWYLIGGPTVAGGSTNTNIVNTGNGNQVSTLTTDVIGNAMMDEMLILLRAIAYGIANLNSLSLDDLIDEANSTSFE